MTSAHIGCPLCHCWCCRHCCHGCRVVVAIAAAIAAIATATATATAVAVSTATTVSPVIAAAFWLIVVCPRAASAAPTVGLPPPLPLLAADAIVTVAAVANRCPPILLPQLQPLCIPLFSLMMFKILLRPSIILNIFHVTFCLIDVCLLLSPPLPAPAVCRRPRQPQQGWRLRLQRQGVATAA